MKFEEAIYAVTQSSLLNLNNALNRAAYIPHCHFSIRIEVKNIICGLRIQPRTYKK